jgi:hypothetical protein
MGRTTALRAALRQSLFPVLEHRGFVIDKSGQPLFTTFRRRVGDDVHVIDLQWDKYGRPNFVLNFGKAPAQGIVRQGQPVPADKAEVFDCQPRLRLQRARGRTTASWYRLRRPWLEQIVRWSRDRNPDEVVGDVVAHLQELEAWYRDGIKGPHVKRIG